MRAARRDQAEGVIVEALREAGCTVVRLSGEAGLPDLLVGRAGGTYLLETKTPKQGRVSEVQAAWHLRWRGRPVAVVRTPEEALAAVGVVLA